MTRFFDLLEYIKVNCIFILRAVRGPISTGPSRNVLFSSKLNNDRHTQCSSGVSHSRPPVEHDSLSSGLETVKKSSNKSTSCSVFGVAFALVPATRRHNRPRATLRTPFGNNEFSASKTIPSPIVLVGREETRPSACAHPAVVNHIPRRPAAGEQ